MLQSDIVTTINASKASISRTLTALENKGVVVKMRKGVYVTAMDEEGNVCESYEIENTESALNGLLLKKDEFNI